MTSRTRGRLVACLILGLIALPVEALLLPVAVTPDPAAAAFAYTASLSPDALQRAAADINAYPAMYRRAIMSELTPQERAEVWRAHLLRYLDSHPDLSPSQAAVVREAMTIVSASALVPSVAPDLREKIGRVFNAAVTELGPRAANELFVTLGPAMPAGSSPLPLVQRLADRVRSWRVASAEVPDCNCNTTMDTCDLVPDPWLQCSELYDCNIDTSWPMCGPFWSWACNGWCRIIRWPGGGGGGMEGM